MVLMCELFIADTDDDNYRPSKRARADFRPPVPSDDDVDGMQSSPGRSRGHSREDVPMTDQTEDDRYEVMSALYFCKKKYLKKSSSSYTV